MFWSNNDEETPESLLKSQGRITVITGVVKSKNKKPLAGYYEAKLEQYAGELYPANIPRTSLSTVPEVSVK